MRVLLAINILILVLLILRKLISNKVSCRMQYGVWIILPIFALVCSFITIPVAIKVETKITDTYQFNSSVKETTDNSSNEELIESTISEVNSKVINNEKVSVDYKDILVLIWISGSVVLGIGILVNNITFARNVKEERRLFAKCPYGNLKIYKISGLDSPFLFWNGIYIPEELSEDSIEYSLAVCHEYCHYKFGDCIWNVIRCLMVVVLWFDPLVWVAYFLSQNDSELAVDEKVLELIGEDSKLKYGEMLLKHISIYSGYNRLMSVATLVNGKNKSFIKTRIMNISNRVETKKYATVIMSCVLLVTCVGLLIKPYAVFADVSNSIPDVPLNVYKLDNGFVPPKNEKNLYFDTSNLDGTSEFVIPECFRHENTPNEVDVRCSVVNVTEDRIYIQIEITDYSNKTIEWHVCCYELNDGKQGALIGTINLVKEISNGFSTYSGLHGIYEADGNVYATVDVWGGVNPGSAFYIYELDFRDGTATYEKSIYLDEVVSGHIVIFKTAYENEILYASGVLLDGSNQEVVYAITNDSYERIELNENSKYTFSKMFNPVFSIE